MNRKQRRAAGIKEREPSIMLKRKDIQKIKDDAVAEATLRALSLMFGMSVKVLHENYQFSKKKLENYGKKLLGELDAFEHNHSQSVEEFNKMVYDYCGISFEVQE